MKMNTVEEIIERVKDIISIRHGARKPLDKDVAQYLGITPKKLSIYKCANKIPYKEVSKFCYHERVSIRWILFCGDLRLESSFLRNEHSLKHK